VLARKHWRRHPKAPALTTLGRSRCGDLDPFNSSKGPENIFLPRQDRTSHAATALRTTLLLSEELDYPMTTRVFFSRQTGPNLSNRLPCPNPPPPKASLAPVHRGNGARRVPLHHLVVGRRHHVVVAGWNGRGGGSVLLELELLVGGRRRRLPPDVAGGFSHRLLSPLAMGSRAALYPAPAPTVVLAVPGEQVACHL